MIKYVFILGGVVSSLGKGIASATLGALLQSRGYKIRMRKMDPYLNLDPGTMSPYQHGEVFVTEDGAETDLDLGHYERFSGVSCHKTDSISGGRIYNNVLMKERRGDYLGATVQMIPHVTDELKRFLDSDLTDEDFVLYEVGGTVGDIEGTLFLEAIRQFANDKGRENCCFIYLTLLPYIETAGELKTKPTQQAVKKLLEAGIQADVLLCRSKKHLGREERRKLSLFCNINEKDVIAALDVKNIYELPLSYHKEGLDVQVLNHFHLLDKAPEVDLSNWKEIIRRMDHPEKETRIAVVGKYCSLLEAYKSLKESLIHAGISLDCKVLIDWVDSEKLESLTDEEFEKTFNSVHGILVPGGFGNRGILGKIKAITYAREHKIPFFGICLGLQLAVIEFCQNVLGIADANSSEFDCACTPLINKMKVWEKDGEKMIRPDNVDMGGTMRLGAYPCHIKKGTLAYKIYGKEEISERHRHRYELDISFEEKLKEKGLLISGKSPDGLLPEIIELKGHPFFFAGQFHPEFKSRPFAPHPVFKAFIEAALKLEEVQE
ncbi:MAG: CTP synthase [Alphaproteobacteria bacterium]|nr:CTP synthase [Alphaproteobacteria bacterium]